MTETNPPPSAWEIIQQGRAKDIAEGRDKPGEEGAFWRLMEIVDTAKVELWLKGEHLRGTPPDQLFGVMSQVVASCALLTASVVARYQIRGAAQDIMRAVAQILEVDINRILKPPAVAMPGQKNVVRMPPRLRRVLAGGDTNQGPTSNVSQAKAPQAVQSAEEDEPIGQRPPQGPRLVEEEKTGPEETQDS